MESNLIPKDYSRCTNHTCKLRSNCKRFMQNQIDERNNVIMVIQNHFTPDKDGKCEHQIVIKYKSKF